MKHSTLSLIALSVVLSLVLPPSQTSAQQPSYFGTAQPGSPATQNPTVQPSLSATLNAPANKTPAVVSPADAKFYAALAVASQGDKLATTPTVGAPTGGKFSDVYPYGAILVGFDVWKGNFGGHLVIRGISSIFQTPAGRIHGVKHGRCNGDLLTLEAKPGFAVAGINAKGGLRVDGFEVVFMRVHEMGVDLDANDSYRSEWVGGREGGKERSLFPNQKLVVGIAGGCGMEVDRLGLLYIDQH